MTGGKIKRFGEDWKKRVRKGKKKRLEDFKLMIEVTGMKKFGFIVLIAMIVGCFNAFGGVTKPAKVEGALIQQIHGVDFIKQTATKDAAWGWSENRKGLYIIDTSGQIINNDKPMIEKMNIIDVFPTKSQNGAWVVAEDDDNNKQLFFISQCTPECEVQRMDIEIGNYKKYSLISSSSYPFAWLTGNLNSNKDNDTITIIKGGKVIDSVISPPYSKIINENHPKVFSRIWYYCCPNKRCFDSSASGIRNPNLSNYSGSGKTYLYSIDIYGTTKSYYFDSGSDSIEKRYVEHLQISSAGNKAVWFLIYSTTYKTDEYYSPNSEKFILYHLHGDKMVKIEEINPFYYSDEPKTSSGRIYAIDENQAWFLFTYFDEITFNKLRFRTSFFLDDEHANLYLVNTTKKFPLKNISIDNVSKVVKTTCFGQVIWCQAKNSLTMVSHKQDKFVKKRFEIKGLKKFSKIDFMEKIDNIDYYWKLFNGEKCKWLQYFGYPGNNKLTGQLLQNYEISNISPAKHNRNALITTDGIKIKESRVFHLSFPIGKEFIPCYIEFGDEYLDSSKNHGKLTYNYTLKTARVNFTRKYNHIGTVTLSICKSDTKSEKPEEASVSLKNGNIVVFEKNPFAKVGKYIIKMNYKDEYGSNLTYTWDNVEVINFNPWYEIQWIRTSILAVFIILMGILSLWSPILKMSKKFRGWLFIGLLSMFGPAGTTFAKEKFFNQYHLDPTLLNIILITFVVVLMLSGALNSKLFRKLAQIQPFSFLSHPALLLRHVRKRFYRDYYNKLYHRLKAEQKNANMECYCPLPATINSEIATLENPLENRQIDDPPSYLFNHLMKPRDNQRRVFLIEGIGGTGKSALARKTLHLFLKQFDKKAKGPIPIYISDASKYKTIAEAIEKELGDHAISTEHLNQKIERGEFVIIIDNLHEKKIPINEINNYLNTIYSNPSPLIGISRYHKDVHGIFEKYPNTTFIHPLPLTNETLDGFVEKYKPGYQLTPAVISACASPDNTFNPLLIRLALLSNSIKATNITDIYDNAITSLLKTASDSGGEDHSKKLRKGAMKLCMDSYWETGERTITVKEDNLDLIKELIGAGLLVSADERSDNKSVNNERSPRWVRFFHDTMQSYLTARALNDTGNWDALAEAAGAPRFSDDLTDTDDKSGTELFLMCLETFGPDETRINHLTQIMNTWAKNEKLNLTISKSVILDALPKSLHQKVIQESKDQSIGKTLETAINICKQKNDDINRFFGRLAPKIYSIVYEKEEKKKRSDEVTE